VPLANGRALNPPMALGRLLTEARLQGDERALVVGAGTGYAAAVLARLVASVTALEEDKALAATARDALADTGVTLVAGPLDKGWAKAAPYDFILVDGAVEYLPPAIVAQAAEGARIGLALLDRGVTRLAMGRVVGGAFGLATFADAAVAILPGFEKPRGFIF
jgi:protein-L-isoaspartate(D-aspartate) O-methyltransferase